MAHHGGQRTISTVGPHLQPYVKQRLFVPPHHCECQEHWPVDYWGLSCVHCHSPRRNAGIADALTACLAFTWALGILTLSPTQPSPQVLSLTFSCLLRNAAWCFSVSMFYGLKHIDLFLKFFNASHSNPGHRNMTKAVFPTHSYFYVCILISFPCDNRIYSFPIWRVLSLIKPGERTDTEEYLVGIIVH